MKKRNLILRYFGFFILIIGVVLNILMILGNAWPTYIYALFCLIGILQIVISNSLKKILIVWQLFLVIITFVVTYSYFHFIN
jgi:hypothetical protein